jgi:hypothetical protein
MPTMTTAKGKREYHVGAPPSGAQRVVLDVECRDDGQYRVVCADLSPAEARELAALLLDAANSVDARETHAAAWRAVADSLTTAEQALASVKMKQCKPAEVEAASALLACMQSVRAVLAS